MIVIDVSMPEFKGEELLELSRQKGPIVLVNTGDETPNLARLPTRYRGWQAESQGLGAETEWSGANREMNSVARTPALTIP